MQGIRVATPPTNHIPGGRAPVQIPPALLPSCRLVVGFIRQDESELAERIGVGWHLRRGAAGGPRPDVTTLRLGLRT